jgi:hypothetical protein
VYYGAVFEVKNEIPIYLPQNAILDKHESGLGNSGNCAEDFLETFVLVCGGISSARVGWLYSATGCPPYPGDERDLSRFFSIHFSLPVVHTGP